VNNGTISYTDTLTKYYGKTNIAFADNCNTLNNWLGEWGVTSSSFYSSPSSITDSPNDDYQPFDISISQVKNLINLKNAKRASLTFWARWAIETYYDYAQVEISEESVC